MKTDTKTTKTKTAATASPTLLAAPAARAALATTRTGTEVCGALSAAALLAVVAVAATGHLVNPFMWTRAALLPLLALLLHRLTAASARGSGRAYDRLRTLSLVCPLAIAGVDLVPGVCPWWYAAVQTLCVLPVLRAAFALRGPALRAAFAGSR